MRNRTHAPYRMPITAPEPASPLPARPALTPASPFATAKTTGREGGDGRLPPAHRPGTTVEKPALPASLRAGIERLSRVSLADVEVHYNSPEPARHQALAFTKGRDIHLAPGEERHLPHEAWHVAQQLQGRVLPTVQDGERKINDDPALEKEADVMGTRAFQLHVKATPVPDQAPLGGLPAPPSPVMQMLYPVTATAQDFASLDKWLEANGQNLEWVALLKDTYEYIEAARQTLEDDDDQAALLAEEDTVDGLAEELDILTKQFPAVPDLDERELNTRSTAKKRKQTQSETKWEAAARIRTKAGDLREALGEIQTRFPLPGGGFSAKGRAHDMGESDMAQVNLAKITTWFDDVTLGGNPLSATKAVYKNLANVKVVEQAGNPILPVDIDQDASAGTQLKELETQIDNDLNQNQFFEHPRAPAPHPRGDGQFANMGHANASAYAKLAGIDSWQQSRWEWLHVRAASLGGKTDGTNLVVGTRDVNTQMMPFESNIRLLGNIVEEDKKHERYKALKATFKVSAPANPAKHKVQNITLGWDLVKADNAPKSVQEVKGQAKFSPLRTNASISKTEVGILETVLKEEREKANTDLP